MKFCRFNSDRLGLIEGDSVFDVSGALDVLPAAGWPHPIGDPLLLNLDAITEAASGLRDGAERFALADVTLHSPITSPSKVMAAPLNYAMHAELDTKDPEVDAGVHRQQAETLERPVEKLGLFLKAASSIVGASEGVTVTLPDRRTDHEVELGVVIGGPAYKTSRDDAMSHVAGYIIGLDMTVRGAEERSYRKSPDSYTVLGPAFVTADEIADPHALTMSLWVNDERRQHSSTGAMTVDIPDLIEFASRVYTLHPGDVILTGTPEGVSPVHPGDSVRVACDGLGEMTFDISG